MDNSYYVQKTKKKGKKKIRSYPIYDYRAISEVYTVHKKFMKKLHSSFESILVYRSSFIPSMSFITFACIR